MSRWKTRKPAVDWHEFVATSTGIDCTKPVIAEALDRLEDSDVSMTRYGIRVEDTDYEFCVGEPPAYWPKWDEDGKPYCRCYKGRAYGECSHFWAAHIYELWLERGSDSAKGEQR